MRTYATARSVEPVTLNERFRVAIERDEMPSVPGFLSASDARIYDCAPCHRWEYRAGGFDAAGAVEGIDPNDNVRRNKALAAAWREWVEEVDGPDVEARDAIVGNGRYLIAATDADALEAHLRSDVYGFFLEVLQGGEWEAVDYLGEVYACDHDGREGLEAAAREWGLQAAAAFPGVAVWETAPGGVSLERAEVDADGALYVVAVDLEPGPDGVRVYSRRGGRREHKATASSMWAGQEIAERVMGHGARDVRGGGFSRAAVEYWHARGEE